MTLIPTVFQSLLLGGALALLLPAPSPTPASGGKESVMLITIADAKHSYDFEYTLPAH